MTELNVSNAEVEKISNSHHVSDDVSRLRDEALSSMAGDQQNRTVGSFSKAASSLRILGRADEVSLELPARNWLIKDSRNNPQVMRGVAAMSYALGTFRLDEGSRIDPTSHQDTKPRALKGYDYDFGGEAETFLGKADSSLQDLEQFAVEHKGQEVGGQAMDDSYVRQIKDLQAVTEAKLNLVYGEHDMLGVYDQVKQQVGSHVQDWQQGLIGLKSSIEEGGHRNGDPRSLAKQDRDLALGYLAFSEYANAHDNKEEAKIYKAAADQYIGASEKADANAPDNAGLRVISTHVKKVLER